MDEAKGEWRRPKKKERTCKLKDTVIEITLSEQQRKNKMKEQK